ncbi:hypothetical protein MEQU1_000732 [Malassezia equina]|uniref:Abasic site processing protein n=1 Tax=Malassezia equina TaxID=1381935 RepID=A0AAF0ECK7_9BASI|nr:hypothetical protein MEQU1_000732 [Malassezia equina]
MCGRFANGLAPQALYDTVDDLLGNEELTSHENALDYCPTYNVAPGTTYPVVHATEASQGFSVVLETMKWGIRHDAMLPSSSFEIRGPLVINSRDDTIVRPASAWHRLATRQRCIVFCQGFFEWEKVPTSKSKRIPHFVGMSVPGRGRPTIEGSSRQLMPMAGLWAEEQGQRAFTIVTTASNKQLSFLHDRMPVILPTAAAMHQWLHARDFQEMASLLQPYDGHLDCYAVPPEVGTVGHSSESLIYPPQTTTFVAITFIQKSARHTMS